MTIVFKTLICIWKYSNYNHLKKCLWLSLLMIPWLTQNALRMNKYRIMSRKFGTFQNIK